MSTSPEPPYVVRPIGARIRRHAEEAAREALAVGVCHHVGLTGAYVVTGQADQGVGCTACARDAAGALLTDPSCSLCDGDPLLGLYGSGLMEALVETTHGPLVVLLRACPACTASDHPADHPAPDHGGLTAPTPEGL